MHLINVLMYFDCWCYVALSHGAVVWSALCECVFSDLTHLPRTFISQYMYVKVPYYY